MQVSVQLSVEAPCQTTTERTETFPVIILPLHSIEHETTDIDSVSTVVALATSLLVHV